MFHNVPASVNQDSILAEHAAEIRALGKRTIKNIIEIGCRLAKCHSILKEDNSWRAWLDRELRLSPQTAGRFIQVYELSQTCSNLAHLDLPVSAIYLLAAPSTPETARAEVVERAQSGEVIQLPEVKRTIDAGKGRRPAAKRVYSSALHREMKLGPEIMKRVKGTSLDNARELDELVFLDRGAPEGGHTKHVEHIVAQAEAGVPVSAVAWKRIGVPPPRGDIGVANAALKPTPERAAREVERLQARNEELERENTALKREIEELRARLLAPTGHGDGLDIPDFLNRTCEIARNKKKKAPATAGARP